MFKKVNPKQNFPEMEKEILSFWKENKIFEKSIEQKNKEKTYSFFDGPPFATGLPHYGHVVASLIKDVIPRYWTMKGYRVGRRWGWDCHGLPIENLVEKEHDIKNKQDIEKWGVDKFNDACHASVLRYADEWKKFIPRIGRWVDMENDYKTMDWKYTESIWWVFSELYKKGLVYEGYKPMHLCPRCETTLSNFEVTLGYKEITDLAATVKFKLKTGQKINNFAVDENTYALAWTTTPWTLPGNVALAVGKDIDYVLLLDKEKWEKYVLSAENYDKIPTEEKGNYEIAEKFKGKSFVGLEYEPLFGYYHDKKDLKNKENGWKIYAGDFVSTEEGTGIVHIATAFGEDDMKLGEKYKLPFVQHVKTNGRFAEEVIDFRDKDGLPSEVKPKRNPREMDEKVVEYLQIKNRLFKKENYKHSYPHCWRCDTPLLNYAATSWFVKVTEIKERMIKNNRQINWVPEYIKEGRFGKWLEDARDWAVSRARFWGAPIPIWKCSKCKHAEVIGSVDELRKKTGRKITKIILVRHGESDSNITKMKGMGKDNNYVLTENGRKQVEQAAKNLEGESIDCIISSPVFRARETAEIISEKIGVKAIEDEAVREHNYGSWDGKSQDFLLKHDELYIKYRQLWNNPEERYGFVLGGNGESRADVEKRVRKFIADLPEKYAGKNVLIVTHAGVIAMFKKIIEEISLEDFFRVESRFDYAGRETIYLSEDGKIFDFHKPNIDAMTIRCPKCRDEARIAGDVFDCWFESGSMPYAQWHYPFENRDKFKKGFPADFIAEGLDQTRGWFYTLIVLSTALFDKPAFKNVIVNGIVLAENGQKMSKRLKNYPEPDLIIEKYGADALRYYLLTSPVMKAENLRFSEKGVEEVLKRFVLTLWNAYSFFVINTYPSADFDKRQIAMPVLSGDEIKSNNLLDKWIISELNILITEVNKQMENYDLVKASRPLREFVDKLSNWYIRRSRRRFALEDMDDRNCASMTLYYTLTEYVKLLAPFMPFLAEEIYKNLTGKESVHLEEYPKVDENLIDKELSQSMDLVRRVTTMVLAIRAKNSIKVRMPLSKLEIGKSENTPIGTNNIYDVKDKFTDAALNDELFDIMKDELNIKEAGYVDKFAIREGWAYEDDGVIKIGLNLEITDELRIEGLAREVVRHIQAMRKEAKYNRDDVILVKYSFAEGGEEIKKVFEVWGDYIKKECLAASIKYAGALNENEFDLVKELKSKELAVEIGIKSLKIKVEVKNDDEK